MRERRWESEGRIIHCSHRVDKIDTHAKRLQTSEGPHQRECFESEERRQGQLADVVTQR